MFILSKIFAKAWFKSLFGSLIVLFILLTVGDIINGFLRGWETKRIFIEYALKMPFLMGKLIPICTLLSTLFAINGLKAHSELIAILAGGYSAKKLYKLVFIFSCFVALFQFLNVGFLQPIANKTKREQFEKSKRNDSKYLARSKIGGTGYLWYKSNNYFSTFSHFDKSKNELHNFYMYYLSNDQKIESIFKAKKAKYYKNDLWLMHDLKIIRSLNQKDIFPKINQEKNLLVSLKEKPSDFVQFESDITTLNIFKLRKFVNRLDTTGINSNEYKVIYLEMIANCLICIVFSLFPMVGIFNPNRRNSSFGKSIVLTLVFTIAFWGIFSAAISLGQSGKIPPIIATLGIPFIFSLFIGKTYLKNRKLA
ncbi:MAG: LptF/LptG family permease [Bacteriovoracaceae bacterium]|jgi:LPS export ABC transporter permease LptG|nr:LptF/LptG family permease [Bacteriovoracaceae bacterium]